jgi:hypothetical protein
MKRTILCLSVCLSTVFSPVTNPIYANEPASPNNSEMERRVDNYISGVYSQINFGKNDPLDKTVFHNAMIGYLNLRNAGKLNSSRNVLTICDFTKSSNDYRFWIIDLNQKKVLFHTYVAHGQGSGDEFARAFSNREDSHQSSLGFYVTGDTYDGEHGLSLRLHGMDHGFNSAAYDRGIVVHGADYVNRNFIAGNQRLGRSWGCPAVPAHLSSAIINTIKDGTCLFVYYPQKNYLKRSYWLNKKTDRLPDDSNPFQLLTAQANPEADCPTVVVPKTQIIVVRDTNTDHRLYIQ